MCVYNIGGGVVVSIVGEAYVAPPTQAKSAPTVVAIGWRWCRACFPPLWLRNKLAGQELWLLIPERATTIARIGWCNRRCQRRPPADSRVRTRPPTSTYADSKRRKSKSIHTVPPDTVEVGIIFRTILGLAGSWALSSGRLSTCMFGYKLTCCVGVIRFGIQM